MVRFRKILCPVDFYSVSLRAFDYALWLAAQYESGVHALHVVAPVITAYETVVAEGVPAKAVKESQRLLERLQKKATKAGIPIATEVRVGDIDDEILRVVETKKADLIVMGTHGRRAFQRWLLGSVMERMMRHSPVPLLAVGPSRTARNARPKIRRILVATDFSEGFSNALAYALSIADKCRAAITLLHVVPDLSNEVGPEFTGPMVTNARKKLEELVPSHLRASSDFRILVEVGTPHKVVRETIGSEEPGLVVMNIHGKGMIDRLILGSTAERVVRGASDPCS